MASSKATSSTQVPRAHHFELVEGMQLQINVTGSSSGRNARIELQLKNCTTTWILHWGYLYRGNVNWFITVDHPSGTAPYMQGAMQTPFRKNGEVYLLIIELRDPNIHAIEFVLKDGSRDRWLKLNHGNFRIEIPENDPTPSHPPIPKDLIDRKAYLLWESRGRPISSPQQQKKDYDDALRELQSQLSKGLSLNELQSSYLTAGASTRFTTNNREEFRSRIPYSYRRRHNVEQWLQKHSEGHMRVQSSALLNLIEKSMGGDIVVSRQSYHVGNYEIVVLLKVVWGDYHILVATNMKGSAVLHWGVSKLSPEEWLAPPPDMLPEKSKMVSGACQTYFTETSTGKGFFQVVDVNLQKRTFVGIQFVIWTGGSWIKNNGKNFFVSLKPMKPSGKIDRDGEGIVRWLLDEIFRREKEAERSLMHRFNIATELMELCKAEGELGLIGILVWFRFMACRHLTWNKNYNVKPREISEAQDKFTNILQRIYLNQPNDREIVRLVMTCVGRGGQGDVGQRIRDEILVLQRNNDCKTGKMEEWHQKLHNNSSPDDVIICEALLNYVRSGFRIDVYWQTLNANGLTKKKLASYDRPIVSEPHFRTDAKEGLIRDLTAYLRTLKAVHSGVDLESAIETCLGSSVKGSVDSVGGLSLKLQDCLNFVKAHVGDENIGPLMEKLLESRIELRSLLLTSHGRLKDLLFLDLALASAVRTSMERGFKDLNFAHPPEPMFFMSLVLESLCLSTVNNEDFIYCTKDWYRVCELYTNDGQWALQTKAVLDRLQLVLSERSQNYQKKIQPSAEYLGNMLGVEKWAIDIFTEELVRAGSAAILSSLIKHFDPIVRKFANVGCWQVISPVEVCGFIVSVNELITTQSKVYRRPTIIVASRVTGNEEIPDGVVAVLTPDMPDVLSHVAIRARNSKVCFATCFDPNILRDLKLKEGKAVSIRLKSTNLVISDISSFNVSQDSFVSFSIPRGISLKRKPFCGKYAVSVEEFTSEMVGAKSCNTKFLRGRVPSWIKIPMSVALPFGAFETVLSEDVNKDIANKIAQFMKYVHHGDLSKLQAVRESVLQMNVPLSLTYELKSKMRSSRMPWPGDEGEERWHHAWQAIKKVWASKWNERAYVSCKKAKLDHGNLCMAVLVQEIICADYAFVIHTKSPLSGDTSEIYTEIVKGLGETLVGAYPGRAMSFITKKTNLMSPIVIGYPSKLKGLYSKQSVIFRSDSNGEDLEGYAGAGLYDSMEPRIDEELEVLDPGPRERSLLTRQPYHRSEAIWNGEDSGPLTCRGRTKEMANIQMQDNRVIDIIKLLRLEGLFRAPSREIDNCLISALVERWRPETHSFHLPHGEMTITLEDVEVIFGLPIDGDVLVGPTAVVDDGGWRRLCTELLGFTPPNDNKTLVGQRILISRLVEAVAAPLPHDATEMQIHRYARCYMLALIGDKLFMDKSGDRVHLMFLDFMRNLRDPPHYSWGSGCLAWLYRELCRASEKGASQIGGACTLVQYWAWARLPFLCPRIEPPPGCDYGPWPYAPLAFKWVRVPSSKSRPSGMALVHYRELLVTMQPEQIVWQPYEAHFSHLPEFCVAGRDMWTARVPLLCFCIVERHHPDRVLRQFGLAQERPDHVVYDDRLHKIDLRGKVERNWREEHGPYIISWEMRRQQVCRAPPQIGEMPRNHAYYVWYRPVTRKYVDRNSAKLDIMIQSHLALLAMLPEGSQAHNHVRRILNNVAGLGGGPAVNEHANNGDETELAAAATPSTSAAPVSTPTRGHRATTSPSTSAARGRLRPATATPSTSAVRGRGRRATTPRVVTTLEMPPPIPQASPQHEVPSPIPYASPQPEVPSPSPPSQPNFDVSIDQNVTPPILPETPSYPHTGSSAPTPGLYIEQDYPPTTSSSDPLGSPVGIDTVEPHIDVPDLNPPHQASPPRGRPQRSRRAPTCGTGGHKIGHRGPAMHDDDPKVDAPQPPPPHKHYTRAKKHKIGEP